MDNETVFLLSWDCNGIEAIVNVTEIEKNTVWAELQNKPTPTPIGSTLNAILLRARYNSQRHYEVYTVRVSDGITEEDLRTMFEENPQGMADLIRERGNKIHSDRFDQKTTKIV